MITNDHERNSLIRYRLEEANESISDVELLIENDRLRAAINRIYYGMFYSLLALGLANGYETSKHAQLIGWFNKDFIHKGIIDKKYGMIINKAFNRRTQGDYDSFVNFEKDLIIEMFNEMKDFIAEIHSFLNDKTDTHFR